MNSIIVKYPMKATLTFICILLITISSCKKEVAEEKNEFIGSWYATIYYDGIATLNISEDSYVTYNIWIEPDNHHKYEGIARANDKHFKIGRTKYFDIIEYPHIIDTATERFLLPDLGEGNKLANWKMVLDGMKPGLLYADGKYAFYKADY